MIYCSSFQEYVMREGRLSYICSSYSVLCTSWCMRTFWFILLRYNSLSAAGLFELTDIILQVTTNSGINFSTTSLGAFTNLRRATISFIMSVYPSVFLPVRMEQPGPHWTDFHYIFKLSIFRNSVQKIPVLLKYDKTIGYFTWRRMCINDNISLHSFWMRNV